MVPMCGAYVSLPCPSLPCRPSLFLPSLFFFVSQPHLLLPFFRLREDRGEPPSWLGALTKMIAKEVGASVGNALKTAFDGEDDGDIMVFFHLFLLLQLFPFFHSFLSFPSFPSFVSFFCFLFTLPSFLFHLFQKSRPCSPGPSPGGLGSPKLV